VGEPSLQPGRHHPGHEAIRPLVRRVTAAVPDLARGAPGWPALRPHHSESAGGRATALGRALELRDGAGALVPTDLIDRSDWPGATREVDAVIGLRDRHAREAASEPLPRIGDPASEPPAG
jgi:hypothetical protein